MRLFLLFMSSLYFMFCFVFFFKQKTAYEMRISDWSSDVCSSDLPVLHRSGRPCCLECDSDRVLARLYQLVWESAMQTDRYHNIEALRAGARRKQIGRASCRERECQYV